MSEVKKPGARDISDLKARLGLKKGGNEVAKQTPSGGMVAPPGARLGSAFVPPPPGVAPPPTAPPQPVIPDARVDPFGAMNAMAAQGAVQAAPQIVVVNDGQPVESVQKKSPIARLKIVALVAVPLVVGIVVGKIAQANSTYNQTIDDAKVLTEEVRNVGRGLQQLYDTLLTAKERGGGQGAFKPNDKELTAQLEQLPLAPPDKQKLFHSNLYHMDPKLVEDTLSFYSDIALLKQKIDTHVRLSKGDEKANVPDSEALRKLGGYRFGAIFRQPRQQGEIFQVEIVQIGAPVCADKQPHPEGCPGGADPIGFQYRPDPTAPLWGTKAWSASDLSADNVVPLAGNTIIDILMRGAKPFYDEVSYMARIKEIDELTSALMERRKALEDLLNRKALEGKRFSL